MTPGMYAGVQIEDIKQRIFTGIGGIEGRCGWRSIRRSVDAGQARKMRMHATTVAQEQVR